MILCMFFVLLLFAGLILTYNNKTFDSYQSPILIPKAEIIKSAQNQLDSQISLLKFSRSSIERSIKQISVDVFAKELFKWTDFAFLINLFRAVLDDSQNNVNLPEQIIQVIEKVLYLDNDDRSLTGRMYAKKADFIYDLIQTFHLINRLILIKAIQLELSNKLLIKNNTNAASLEFNRQMSSYDQLVSNDQKLVYWIIKKVLGQLSNQSHKSENLELVQFLEEAHRIVDAKELTESMKSSVKRFEAMYCLWNDMKGVDSPGQQQGWLWIGLTWATACIFFGLINYNFNR